MHLLLCLTHSMRMVMFLLIPVVSFLVVVVVVPSLGSTRTMPRTGHKCLCFSLEERTHTSHINNH